MRAFRVFFLLIFSGLVSFGQLCQKERSYNKVLNSIDGHRGTAIWKMKKSSEVSDIAEHISTVAFQENNWMPAIVPGTVLNSLVYNKVYPEPYYGLNNKITSNLIPDLNKVGRDFYTYWFRTEFDLTNEEHSGKKTWLQVDGINYRAEIWLNGNLVGNVAGMFYQDLINITDYIVPGSKNVLAIKVIPVDVPGGPREGISKSWGAAGEFRNGGNGEIGKNVTMLMTVGWDFTFLDGIRDRNTGIWKEISIFTTGDVTLRHPFIKSNLFKPDYNRSAQTVSVEVYNPTFKNQKVKVKGKIENITFEKEIELFRGEVRELAFTPDEFPQLIIENPRLWWPRNKGPTGTIQS